MTLPKALQMMLTKRIIDDLQLKMIFIRKSPIEKLTQLFLELCDSGIELYIQSELLKYPDITKSEIMKRYYLARGNH